jgi:hypothetical protein
MIGQAVKRDQLDRLRVVRCGVSAPWLMQLEERGTCALPPSAVHQLFCRNQTGDLHPITREPHKKRRRRDSTLVGQPRGICQSLYKKPLLGARLLNCNQHQHKQSASTTSRHLPKQHLQTTLPPTNQPFIIMGGCGNSGCSCANCSCAPGACSCNVRSLLPTLACSVPVPDSSILQK